mgnify:FL=1
MWALLLICKVDEINAKGVGRCNDIVVDGLLVFWCVAVNVAGSALYTARSTVRSSCNLYLRKYTG